MKLHLAGDNELLLVRAYDERSITVDGQRYHRSLILMPQRIIPDWRPQLLAELVEQDLRQVLEMGPEMMLLGTGRRLQFPHPRLSALVQANAVGLEVMDTAAACRTYNILASEGRRVAAALLVSAA